MTRAESSEPSFGFQYGVHRWIKALVFDEFRETHPQSVVLEQNPIYGRVADPPVRLRDDVDAGEIAADSVLFAGTSAVEWHLEDVNNDGCEDLVLYFETQALLLENNSIDASITGFLTSGAPFKGTDSVKVISK